MDLKDQELQNLGREYQELKRTDTTAELHEKVFALQNDQQLKKAVIEDLQQQMNKSQQAM